MSRLHPVGRVTSGPGQRIQVTGQERKSNTQGFSLAGLDWTRQYATRTNIAELADLPPERCCSSPAVCVLGGVVLRRDEHIRGTLLLAETRPCPSASYTNLR